MRYWMLRHAKMTPDEVAYLMGNTPSTTFGRYYCDYLNDTSQLILYTKLMRLNAVISNQDGSALSSMTSEKVCTQYNAVFEGNNYPAQIDLTLVTSRNKADAKITVAADKGITCFMTKALEKGAEKSDR